ncbi:MAG: YkgJ family cysteine cluster protein [Thermodesulfobacteriota bacterium]|nr:YkgJ family cysteine cluster protein [Thermodesulfobacteriota bacterium]
MKTIDADKIDDLPGQPLSENNTFSFACHAGLGCFNQCCRNLNMFLYPYDVLRLRKNMGISSGEFIDRHVDIVLREGSYFPDVLLSMADNAEKTCPFLTDGGCSVYPDRSYSCRMFPVEQGLMYGKDGAPQLVHFYRPPDFCEGKHEDNPMTPAQWIKDQVAETHNKMTREWAAVKGLFFSNPWPTGDGFGEDTYGPKAKMAFMAAYNIDAFRDFVFNSSFLKRYKIKKDLLKKVRASDAELMRLGFEWIRSYVWGVESKKLRLK